MNVFAERDEVVFITYDDIIKTFKPYVLKQLLTDEYRSNYEGFIDYSRFEKLNDEELLTLSIRSVCPNILEYLALVDFDFESTYIDLVNSSEDIVKESKLLQIGKTMNQLILQSTTKHVYIYTPLYDNRIYNDIPTNFARADKISYVNGTIDDVLANIKDDITCYMLNDVMLINDLIRLKRVRYSSIMVADNGYNYKLNDDGDPILKLDGIDDLASKEVFKVVTFLTDNTAKFN